MFLPTQNFKIGKVFHIRTEKLSVRALNVSMKVSAVHVNPEVKNE